MFSPRMQRLAAMYEQKTSMMNRVTEKFKSILGSSAQTVSSLRQKLSGLASGFKIRVDSSGLDEANRKAGKLRDSFGRFLPGGGGSGGFKGALLGGVLGAGIGGMAMGAVDLIKDQLQTISEKTIGAAQGSQSTMFTLKELMGKGNAAALVKNVDAYAPEKRDQLLTSAQKLSGAGVGSDRMMDTLKYLNNVSALTNTKVDELAMIQAKIKATGYVQGDEINMFKERGINLNPYLAKVMGAKETDIAKLQSKGLITYDIFDKAMQKYAGKGSQYEKVYERKMLETTEGRQQLVGGKIDAKLLAVGNMLLPIKDQILLMMNDVLNGTGPVVEIFKRLWSAVSPVYDGIIRLLQGFGILNEQGQISQGIFSTISILWEYLTNVFKIAGGAIWVVSKIIGWLVGSPLAMLIVGIYGAVKAWGLLNVIMGLNPFALVVIGITALTAGIMLAWEKFDGFREAVLRIWEVIKSVFANIGGFLKAILTGDITTAVAIVGNVITSSRANGEKSVHLDRLERLNERRAGRKERDKGLSGLDFADGKTSPGSGSLGQAAGLSSTVGNSKSSNVTINIKSLIEKSEITVMEAKDGFADLESKLIEVLLRVANSGTRAVTA